MRSRHQPEALSDRSERADGLGVGPARVRHACMGRHIFAPAGTSNDIVAKLHADLVKAARLPDVRDRMTSLGADVVVGTPAESRRSSGRTRRSGRVVKISGRRLIDRAIVATAFASWRRSRPPPTRPTHPPDPPHRRLSARRQHVHAARLVAQISRRSFRRTSSSTPLRRERHDRRGHRRQGRADGHTRRSRRHPKRRSTRASLKNPPTIRSGTSSR